jgi:hypothetical protein
MLLHQNAHAFQQSLGFSQLVPCNCSELHSVTLDIALPTGSNRRETNVNVANQRRDMTTSFPT